MTPVSGVNCRQQQVLRSHGTNVAGHALNGTLGLAFADEIGFRLESDPDTVRAPDAGFVARERVEAIGIPQGYWPGPPDLAVEVVSPNDRRSALEAKALHWLDAGTRIVVVLDPPLRAATVYRSRHDVRILEGAEPLDLSDLIPGFASMTDHLFPTQ